MASRLSPAAQQRYNTLAGFADKVHRIHGLVELYATTKAKPEQYLVPIGRAFGQLRLQFLGEALDPMAQLCASMEMTVRRGLSATAKARILRESVGSLRSQLELAQRALVADELTAQQAAHPADNE